jgi:hypothetical protein
MEFTISFSEINWLSVVVAAVVAFAIGGLWYSPLLFSKIWQSELKLKEEDLKNASMPLIFGTTFILNLIAAVTLDAFIGPNSTLVGGLLSGLLVSIVWISTDLGINYLFARKTLRLFLIDAGYFVVFFAIMGAILGAW